MTARLIIGDTRAVTATLPDASVDLILTSPPFLALRSYLPADHPDKASEIGSEATPGEFLDVLLDLTEEWRRVLAPHGSICVELGDTYSGSGGAGGDYGEGGLREGQEKFDGSGRRGAELSLLPAGRTIQGNGLSNGMPRKGDGWPLAKSLCLVPELYRLALAYGHNPLTGRQTPRWRVRNVVRWHRPNPPVGALGDKFRPATSDMVIACVSGQRYFDLDAVRQPYSENTNARTAKGVDQQQRTGKSADRDGNWASLPERNNDGAGAPPLDTWIIPTEPYKGSHYATWPTALLTRPIQAMCPPFVCLDCGTPLGLNRDRPRTVPGVRRADHGAVGEVAERSPEAAVLLEGLLQSAHGSQQSLYEGLDSRPEGLHPHSGPATSNGESRGLRDGTPPRDGGTARTDADGGRGRSPHQRGEGRQPSGEPGSAGQTGARPEAEASGLAHDAVPSLWRVDPGAESCPRCAGRLRRGRVLDPFAGSGTTLAVATGHGRDAIGIDLDERNAELARERVGMWLEVEHHKEVAA